MAASNEMRSDASPQFPGFFTVIIQKTLQDKKMRIPVRFLRHYSDAFLDEVNLIVPNGHSWKVGLTRSDDKSYFDRNWNEFMEHYSICKNHLLVFKYKGVSTFKVRIFYPSGCEVHYPSIEATQEPEIDVEDSIGAAALSSLEQRRTHKGGCSYKMLAPEENQEKSAASPPGISTQKKRNTKTNQCEAEAEAVENNINGEMGHYSTFLGNGRAMQCCRSFKTKFPCFTILMRRYHFKHNFVYLPSKLGAKFQKTPEFINLQSFDRGDSKKWRVKVNKRGAQDKTLNRKRFTLGNGWLSFQRENGLKKGDVCVFELFKRSTWKVHIFRD